MSEAAYAGRDLIIVFFVPDNIDANTHQTIVDMVTSNSEANENYYTPNNKWNIFP